MLAFAVCATTFALAHAPPLPTSPFDDYGVDVDAILDGITVEHKVGQLLLLGFGGTRVDDTVAGFLDEMKPGGIALFSRNIESTDQTMRLIRDAHQHDPAGIPMFVSVDQEGGTVVRLKRDALILPSAMALGAARDPALAERAGAMLGRDLRAIGFNMNLAPVLDVNSNPKNPVIGIRSFSSDPAVVADIGVAFMRGMQREGVLAVAKHFPGHGDTDTDSHYHLPVLMHDRERLDRVELLPFARAFAEGLDAVMTAHIALANLTAEHSDLPATVSAAVLTGVLREQLAWDGLVITDGLEMQGIVERFGSGEAAVRAVVAGADMVMVLWFPEKKREVREALLAAVQSGRIPMWRLNQAVRRVLIAKAKRALFQLPPVPIDAARAQLQHERRAALQQEIAARAITQLKNRDHTLPLRRQRVVVASSKPLFASMVSAALGGATVPLAHAPTKERVLADIARIIALAKDADVVVLGVQSSDYLAAVRAIKQLGRVRVVLVSFGSPYLGDAAPEADAFVCAYGFREDSERAAAQVVLGRDVARGISPT